MTEKTEMIRELGEEGLLLPVIVNAALSANDRIKYYFALIQAAQSKADNPNIEFSTLFREREAADVEQNLFDSVVEGSGRTSPSVYLIPHSDEILNELRRSLREMLAPFLMQESAEGSVFQERLETLLADLPDGENGSITGETIGKITTGGQGGRDSLHLLVMDMHRSLNALQNSLSRESIDGAMTYLLEESDKTLVKSFMTGLKETAPLRFDHAGLGTTATRTGNRIVIQNDIGVTDAHVLVIHIDGTDVTVTYTDIHMPRLQFFQSLFDKWEVQWDDMLSRRGTAFAEKKLYHLSSGRYHSKDTADLARFLEFLGSRIVFLIDWNRARKRLRNFLLNKDCITVLRWGADQEVGHIAFLLLGGERLIYDALELAAKTPLRYGEPLHQILGRENAIEYFEWVLKATATGILANHSRQLIQDEVKAELLRYFHSARENLMEICEEHATFTIEVAIVVRDSLVHIQRSENGDIAVRSAARAKQWESRADALVNKVRSLSRRVETAEFYSELINVSDDALDFLEEASFFTTLIPTTTHSKRMVRELTQIAEIAVKESQEYLKALIASQYVHEGYSREEMQDFLKAVDRVISLERDADETLRNAEKIILAESMDYKELTVFFEIARIIEGSTNSLMKAVFILRDSILEGMNR